MRRHPTMLERGLYAARMVNVEHGGDRRSRRSIDHLDLVTPLDAARRIGVSEITVIRSRFIIEHSVAELLAIFDTGVWWLSLSYAHKLAHWSEEDQRRWVKDHEYVGKPVKRTARPPRVPIPWTDSQLKALTDDQRAVIFEKVAAGASRGLSDEKAAAIFKKLADKANHALSDEDALAIAAKLTAKHAPAKDEGEA
jgi:hypothetical protein